jgi:hypothetical protein
MMLNFAEQTGSGAVIMVWSFLPNSISCALASKQANLNHFLQGIPTTSFGDPDYLPKSIHFPKPSLQDSPNSPLWESSDY